MPSEREFGTILTQAGNAAIANALLTGQKANWARVCVGDANGYDYTPDASQTALRHQTWDGPISEMWMADDAGNQIVIHAVIPSNVGGFSIREIGVLDENGVLVAVGNTPTQEKATGANKVIMDMDLYIHVLVSNAEVVNIMVDPTVAIASKADLDRLREELLAEMAGFTAVGSITNAEIDEITGTPVSGSSPVPGGSVESITEEEIDEITGTPLEPSVVEGESLSRDEVARILDDDPDNDPPYDRQPGALTPDEIKSILEG